MIDIGKEYDIKLIKDLVKEDKVISRIYGFILYTEKDPYVAKVLSDDFFWAALNKRSGDYWPIFSVRPLARKKIGYSGFKPGCIGFMMMTSYEPSSNLRILKDFGLEDSDDLPLFVIFMWDDQDNLNQLTIPIEGDDEKSVYHSLETIVETVTQVEAKILPEYKHSENVFRNVKNELEAMQIRKVTFKRVNALWRLIDFFRSLK